MLPFTHRARIENAHHVAARRLCLGCGACAAVCPEGNIRLVDVEDDGIRPFIAAEGCRGCDRCLRACPGINTSVTEFGPAAGNSEPTADKRWGRYIELWEGYAGDTEIRFKGSSGGLCTALALFCIERGLADGVLHVGSDPRNPLKNRTVRSTTRDELVARTGSRYSPASPCEGFPAIEQAAGNSVFIGKPCDVAGLRMAQTLRPGLAAKTSLAIGFFCAGTPSTAGTLDLLRRNGIDPADLAGFRYRGCGWPGAAAAQFKDAARQAWKLSYSESWGFVQKYRPFRCYLCPDLTGEFADISVGDPWYRDIGENEIGRSLIMVRTEKGRAIFHQALKAGYIAAEPGSPDLIERSQHNLLGKRQEIWGRLLAMRLLGIHRPKLDGFHLFENWMELSMERKLKSVIGTMRRIIARNYFKPRTLF